MNLLVNYHIRWMIRADMPHVLRIEHQSFDSPWNDEDFARCLRQRNIIGMVALLGEEVVGHMIYELCKTRLQVINFAVRKDIRRMRVGEAMVKKLKSKLSLFGRNKIRLEVRETNLVAQLFFRDQGFRAVNTVRNRYEKADEDAYIMQHRYIASELEVAARKAA